MAQKSDIFKEASAKFLKILRENILGLTQPDFASLFGVTTRTIQKWEKNGIPKALVKLDKLHAELSSNGSKTQKTNISSDNIARACKEIERFRTLILEGRSSELTEFLERLNGELGSVSELFDSLQSFQGTLVSLVEQLGLIPRLDAANMVMAAEVGEIQELTKMQSGQLVGLTESIDILSKDVERSLKMLHEISDSRHGNEAEYAALRSQIQEIMKAQQEITSWFEGSMNRETEIAQTIKAATAQHSNETASIRATLVKMHAQLERLMANQEKLEAMDEASTQYPNWVSNEADWQRVVKSHRPTTEDDRQQLYNLMKQANRPEEDLRQIVQYGLFSKDEYGRIFIELKGEWVTKLTHDTTLSFGVALGIMLPIWFSNGVPSNTALFAIFTIISIMTLVGVVFQRVIVRPSFTAQLWLKGRDRRTGLWGLLDRVALVSTLASFGSRTA